MPRLKHVSPRVLITRPVKQAQALANLLQAAGIETLCYPVLKIVPILTDPKAILAKSTHQTDWIIFTSVNAVEYALPHLKMLWQTNEQVYPMPQLIAIGQATANALDQANFTVACLPDQDFSSEGLLAMPFMQDCQGKHITILGGVGGRTYLQTVLTQRGGMVNKCGLYQRVAGCKPTSLQLQVWQQAQLDAIIVTSGQSLTQLVKLVGNTAANAKWLKAQQLLLISDRLVPLATQCGFVRTPWVALNASDKGLLAALQNRNE